MTTIINQEVSDKFALYHGDCVEVTRGLPSDSVGYSIFSPPFSSLYTYSNSTRDMGNVRNSTEFFAHFQYLVTELFRVLKPGRLLSFHCMQLPLTKERDCIIGLRDFRGELIRMFIGNEGQVMADAIRVLAIRSKIAELEGDGARALKLENAAFVIAEDMDKYHGPAGFVLHSEVTIWKDPVTAMQRTKAIGLLYKQLRKDSALSRQGIADYLVTMRKPGVNPDPVTKTHESFPVGLWQNYASPVWMDIDAGRTLAREGAREDEDERHICPLQLDVIERAIRLWTNEGDLVLSPFMGIGSEGHQALLQKRRFIGTELKQSYWEQAVGNLKWAEKNAESQQSLFSEVS